METMSRKERRRNGYLPVVTSSSKSKGRQQHQRNKPNRGIFSTVMFSVGLLTAGVGMVAVTATIHPGAEPDENFAGIPEDKSVIEVLAQGVNVPGAEENDGKQFDDVMLNSVNEDKAVLESNVSNPEIVQKSKEFAKKHLQKIGYQSSEFQCLDTLYTRESNWRHTASNPASGAYGIAQALPGAKMGSVANDWQNNPETQIVWGLQYIKSRYGSPCGAMSFWNSNHWY